MLSAFVGAVPEAHLSRLEWRKPTPAAQAALTQRASRLIRSLVRTPVTSLRRCQLSNSLSILCTVSAMQ